MVKCAMGQNMSNEDARALRLIVERYSPNTILYAIRGHYTPKIVGEEMCVSNGWFMDESVRTVMGVAIQNLGG